MKQNYNIFCPQKQKETWQVKRKIYKLLSGAKQGLFALALTVFSGAAYSQATYTYNYTGSVQALSLPLGTYSIQMWGGDGYTQTAGYNGKGGYASGILTLASAQTIYIYVGGLGSYPASTVIPNTWTFNGGGIGYPANNASYGNGGGASDIRTVGGAWDNATSLASRAIVAGGGSAGRNSSYIGANGGGLTGGTGTYFSPDQTGGPTGGSQTAGGSNTGYTSGLTQATLGKAMTWDGNSLTASFLAGGGGGYYGGASGRVAGGGGSSYIGGVTSGTTIMYGQTGFVSNPTAATGNGMVLITELCNISLTASGSNSLAPAICSGQSLTLTTDGISNYAWSTGNTTSPTIAVSPTTTTVYTLSATSPSNCTAARSITVIVNATSPVLSLTTSPGSNSICLGQTATLTAAGAVSYTWTGGAGNVTNAVTFTPTATANYTVTGVNGCGTATAVATMSVLPLPVVAAASSTLVCSTNPVTLTATGATSYTWTTLTSTSTSSTYIVNPANNTTYSLSGVTGPCSGVTTINITTKSLPTLTITPGSTVACQGDAVNLTVSGTATAYVWSPGNQTGTSISVTPTTTTLYSVIGTNTNNCVNSTNQVIIVNTNPVVNASVTNPVVCSGGSATLNASGANTYAWTSGGNTSVTVVNPTANSAYTVTGTDANNCQGTATVSVDVYIPSISVSGDAAICAGTGTTISASGADTYQWSNGVGLSSTNVSPTLTTVYTVTGSVTDPVSNIACDATNSVQVTVNDNPAVTVSADHSVICLGTSAVLTAGGASTYTWTGGSGAVASATNAVSPIANQTYSVAGTDNNGCVGKTSITVNVSACTGISSLSGNTANLQIYPNPSNGEINISSNQAISLQLSNELGQVIRSITLNGTGETVKINSLAHGIYFITGQNANGSVKQKVVITK